MDQGIENTRRDGDLLMVEHHHADVFDRPCKDCGFLEILGERCRFLDFRQFDDQLRIFQRQVCRIAEA